MADMIDILRKDALLKRINGISGGNRIVWSAKDTAKIRDYVMAVPERTIRDAPPMTLSKFVELDPAAIRRKFSVNRDAQPSDLNFLFTISSEQVDLAGDVVKVNGIDCFNFNKNPPVLNAHDSSALPIAVSTAPWLSDKSLMAVAKFPQPGISADSDQVAAAIRAGLVRGASIGFVPTKWSFSTDPSRPFGVDFQAVRLIEWSVCSVPCNPGCLLVGTVSGGKSASDVEMTARRHEAMALVARARAISESISDPVPMTREQRIAQAVEFRRLAYRV